MNHITLRQAYKELRLSTTYPENRKRIHSLLQEVESYSGRDSMMTMMYQQVRDSSEAKEHEQNLMNLLKYVRGVIRWNNKDETDLLIELRLKKREVEIKKNELEIGILEGVELSAEMQGQRHLFTDVRSVLRG